MMDRVGGVWQTSVRQRGRIGTSRRLARYIVQALLPAEDDLGGNRTTAPTRVTVWHDGVCPLCRREIAVMRRLDRRGAIDFVDLAGAGACPIDRAEMLARFHAREGKGPLLSGAAAFAAMWRAIPLLRPLGLAARDPRVLAVLEQLYGGFLRVRPRLQRWLGRSAVRA